MVELLAKGTDEILRMIDEVFAKLKQVREEFAAKLKEALSKDAKTEEFFRKIEKKLILRERKYYLQVKSKN